MECINFISVQLHIPGAPQSIQLGNAAATTGSTSIPYGLSTGKGWVGGKEGEREREREMGPLSSKHVSREKERERERRGGDRQTQTDKQTDIERGPVSSKDME